LGLGVHTDLLPRDASGRVLGSQIVGGNRVTGKGHNAAGFRDPTSPYV
jgi:hypothetical protein